jgi:hypothetical protein
MLESSAACPGTERGRWRALDLRRRGMKKGKRSAGWQEEEQGPAGKIEFDLADDDTEAIIDLEDILEVDDESFLEDDDQLDLDVEILDADADLDADDLDVGLSDDDEDLLEDDFLKELSAARDEPAPDQDEGLDLLEGAESEEDVDFESLLKIEMDEEEEAEGKDRGPMEKVAAGAALAGLMDGEGEAGSLSLEPFVAQIEERLIDAVRQIVEEKLPEIVRSLLEEQIEKLKRELH